MKIRLTRGCIVPGHPHAQPGDVLDVPPNIAQDLLAIGRAVRVEDAAPVQAIEVREPVIENRDPEPVTIKKRSKSKLP